MNYLTSTLKSNYCKLVFLIAFVLSYFLIPSKDFYGLFSLLVVTFMAVFALVTTCIVKNFKEQFNTSKTIKGTSLTAVAAALGLISLQVCTVGAPVCGAAIGLSLLAVVIPSATLGLIRDYATLIIIITILLQLISLKYMNCFKKTKTLLK